MTSTPSRRLRGGLAFLALAFSAAACGGTTATAAPAATSATAPSTAPSAAPSVAATSEATAGASLATTGRIEFPDKGFAVTLPQGWTRIDLKAQDLDALMKAAGESNPALAQAYSAQIKAMVASGLVLFAFGPNPATGTNVNILVAPSMGVSMDLFEQANVAQIKSLTNSAVTTERVQLPAGQALHLKYDLAMASLSTSAPIEQYMILTDTQQYVVSVTNAQPGEAGAIASSIELLK